MTTNDMPIIDPLGFDALNLIPFQINPHYLDKKVEGHGGESREDRILEFIEVNREVYVAGLREGCMFVVEGDKMRIIGQRNLRLFKYGEETREIALDGAYQAVIDFPAFRLPGDFREKFFFIETSLYEGDALRARSFYWPKVLAAMDDPDFRAKRREGMQPNLMFEKGPWLKRQIAEGPKTHLTATVDGCQREGCRLSFRLTVKNDGPVPAFPVHPDTVDDGTVCAMEDSFFMLRPGEVRVLRGDVLLRYNAPDVPTLRLNAWNAPGIDLPLN